MTGPVRPVEIRLDGRLVTAFFPRRAELGQVDMEVKREARARTIVYKLEATAISVDLEAVAKLASWEDWLPTIATPTETQDPLRLAAKALDAVLPGAAVTSQSTGSRRGRTLVPDDDAGSDRTVRRLWDADVHCLIDHCLPRERVRQGAEEEEEAEEVLQELEEQEENQVLQEEQRLLPNQRQPGRIKPCFQLVHNGRRPDGVERLSMLAFMTKAAEVAGNRDSPTLHTRAKEVFNK